MGQALRVPGDLARRMNRDGIPIESGQELLDVLQEQIVLAHRVPIWRALMIVASDLTTARMYVRRTQSGTDGSGPVFRVASVVA